MTWCAVREIRDGQAGTGFTRDQPKELSRGRSSSAEGCSKCTVCTRNLCIFSKRSTYDRIQYIFSSKLCEQEVKSVKVIAFSSLVGNLVSDRAWQRSLCRRHRCLTSFGHRFFVVKGWCSARCLHDQHPL
jgi:hypothetical protein